MDDDKFMSDILETAIAEIGLKKDEQKEENDTLVSKVEKMISKF